MCHIAGYMAGFILSTSQDKNRILPYPYLKDISGDNAVSEQSPDFLIVK